MKKYNLETIKKLVEHHLDIDDLANPTRLQQYVYGRFMYFKLATDHSKTSMTRIGKTVNRDHSTVCYAKDKFDELTLYNKQYAYLRDIYNKINSILENNSVTTILEQDNLANNQNDLLDLSNLILRLDNVEVELSSVKSLLQTLLDESKQNTIRQTKNAMENITEWSH